MKSKILWTKNKKKLSRRSLKYLEIFLIKINKQEKKKPFGEAQRKTWPITCKGEVDPQFDPVCQQKQLCLLDPLT